MFLGIWSGHVPNTCPTGEDGSALDHNTKGIAINITHDDTATSWHDLTDQLTPEQVRRFEHFEAMALNAKRDAAPDEHDTADELLTGLLTEARWEAQQNLTDAMIGLPLPDGAENAGHWDDGGEGNWTHDLQGRARTVDGFDAAV